MKSCKPPSARARQALTTILARSAADEAPDRMPAEVEDAYRVLWEEAGLGAEGPAGAPGNDGGPSATRPGPVNRA